MPNYKLTQKFQDKVFLDSNFQHGPDWAHSLDKEHLYRQFMNT